MLSVCPHCKKQIEHEDYLFEVACTCGTRFNPFDVATEDSTSAPGAEASAEGMESEIVDFSESSATIQEIREFGEALGDPEAEQALVEKTKKTAIKTAPVTAQSSVPISSSGSVLFTSGDQLDGYKIDGYLGFVSSIAEIDFASDHPLAPIIDQISRQAIARQANGVLSFQWCLTPDGAKAIASGNAVHCTKCE